MRLIPGPVEIDGVELLASREQLAVYIMKMMS